jgi:hypothetical protein
MMPKSVATLCSLPDELILEILHSFNSVHSYEPQSTAFKNKEKEKARQCANLQSQSALYSLCLTCHRLRRLAIPFLYAAFEGSTTWHGSKPLQLFHRTICNPDLGIGLKVHFAEHLNYVENRLSDHLGNSLYHDTEIEGADNMTTQYFHLLADIVASAPNVEHLSVVSIETDEVSFWQYILPANSTPWHGSSSTVVSSHGFQKLQTFCFQIHTEGFRSGPHATWLHRICSALTAVPLLTDLRASGVMGGYSTLPSFGNFKRLQRFDITECVLTLDQVIQAWTACESLRHIVCEWAFLICGSEAPSDLYAGLLRHSTTLETLHLDMREVRFDESLTIPGQRLGTLQPFIALKSLCLCEATLLGNTLPLIGLPDDVLHPSITELLPIGVERFAFLLYSNSSYENTDRLDAALSSWNLFEDCERGLPKLREVTLKARQDLCAPHATRNFESLGICLNFLKEFKTESFY